MFAGKDPAVRASYARWREALAALGPCREEPKQTSVHLARASGFAGVHPRKSALLLNLRTAGPIDSPRVVKREQVSKNRWHNEVRLASATEVDAELLAWLREAYVLAH
ncbi:MAG: DUF5655 domain-containing protein [Chloroflexota bacterium]|nr:DUF5655 domain-containing protein [Chloroflexota bacterium]